MLEFLFTVLSTLFYILSCRWNRLFRKTLHHKYVVSLEKVDPVLKLSGVEMAKMIKKKKITVKKLVELHIEQIDASKVITNSVVQDRFEEARKEAEKCDEILSRTEDPNTLPIFFGVPMSVKESFGVKGMSNTSGIVSRKNLRAKTTSPAVKRLVDAGCIILCVTNTSEACLWIESSNYVTGRSSNPWDSRHTCGGSSGGESANVSSCGAPFGVGGDIGGSLRIPAFFCGVFSHKPSPHIVCNDGHYPTVRNEQLDFMGTGPICRKAIDLYPTMKVLCDKPDRLGDPSKVDLSTLEIWNVDKIDRIYLRDVSKDLHECQLSVCDYLEQLGAKVNHKAPVNFDYSLEIWAAMMQGADSPTFYEHLMKPFVLWELLKWMVNSSNFTLPALIMCYAENLPNLVPTIKQDYINQGLELKKKIKEILGKNGVLVFPSYSVLAPKHNHAKFFPIRFAYAAIFNVLGLPVTQVPIGVSDTGLPMGVQIVSNEGNDHITIAVAMELERKFGGWQLDKVHLNKQK
jgi:fatty acid amide hydrolase 2